jgi:hypothetical protein
VKVYLLYEDIDSKYSVSREWSFETLIEAKSFCEGLNVGLEKGRCDFNIAVLEGDSKLTEEIK